MNNINTVASETLSVDDPIIRLTASAVEYMKEMLQQNPEALGIRVGVKSGKGCSGLSYVLDFARDQHADDQSFKVEDLLIVVDSNSIPYLRRTEIHCVQEGLNRYLKFNNPNTTGECGCGESFSVE